MAKFLASLQAYESLRSRAVGRASQPDFLATHPSTPARVERARVLANSEAALAPNPRIGEADYLFTIDGMIYGDDPAEGVLRGQTFSNASLRFRFEVPAGFSLVNSPSRIVMRDKNSAAVVLDTAHQPYAGDLRDYLQKAWAPDVALTSVEAIDVNGLDAATAASRIDTSQGARDLRLIVIRQAENRIFRFLILTPTSVTQTLAAELRRMTYSFRALSDAEAAAIQPLRIAVRPAEAGETQASLAATMPFREYQLERFDVLNALAPSDALKPGQLIKLVR